ncbi:MAG: extracellular solute-binding protein [Lachnospiraceae bacterium]|nr:extracellular solute-binding protein [uncultured Acetatifactor sp.]MCI8544173.1 extracellular solute-binding protein [Lachnospiraceae bacterium]
MKAKKKWRFWALLLTSAMLAGSLAACGSDNAGEGQAPETESKTESQAEPKEELEADTDDAGDDEIVKLQMFSLPSNSSGVVEGWWAEEVKRQVGVTIELIPCGDQGEQKLNALMGSGELPDIVCFKDYKQVENAVMGDMLLAYDDYKELLPDLYANAEIPLRYAADKLSCGKGKAYTVGTDAKLFMETRGDKEPWLRYDLYKQIGSPEITSLNDYLSVLQQMQEIEPANADGQKVYGLSIWKDWDRTFMCLAMFAGKFSGVEMIEGTLVEIDYNVNPPKVRSILDEDSLYLKFIDFLYQANQMGLLDPDSMTQRFDDATNKMGSGRVLMGLGNWGVSDFATPEKQEEGIGHMPVFVKDSPTVTEGLQPIGRTWTVSVSKACKNPEAAMRFINYMFSFDGAMLQRNGPKGITWDVDENGNPYVTEEGYEYMQDGKKELPEGKGLYDGCPQTWAALHITTQNPDLNNTPIGNSFWEKKEYAPKDTKLVDMWQEDYDAVDSIDYLTKNNLLIPFQFVGYPILTDDMEQLAARVGDVVTTNSWKMAFAKDDAEYEALKAEMIEKAENMGSNDFVEWWAGEYDKALEEASDYLE